MMDPPGSSPEEVEEFGVELQPEEVEEEFEVELRLQPTAGPSPGSG